MSFTNVLVSVVRDLADLEVVKGDGMTGIEYSTFSSCGRSLSVGVVGNGEPLMLIPGTLQSARRWIDSGYVDALRDDYRLLLFDPLGHGKSERSINANDYAPDRLIDHLVDALDHVSESSAHLWGYSRGAQMAGHLSRERPERVRSLICGGHVLFDPAPVLEELGLAPDPEARATSEARAATGDWGAFWETFPVPIPDATKAMLQEGNDPAVLTAATQGARLGAMVWAPPPVPTLAYWGEDEIFHSLNVNEAQPPIEWFTVPGGHAEAFYPSGPASTRVIPFLAKQSRTC